MQGDEKKNKRKGDNSEDNENENGDEREMLNRKNFMSVKKNRIGIDICNCWEGYEMKKKKKADAISGYKIKLDDFVHINLTHYQ